MPVYKNGGESDLPAVKRYITTHDSNGKAIFYTSPDSSLTDEVNLKFQDPAALHVHYATTSFPVKFQHEQDVSAFLKPSGPETLSNKNGTVARMVDLKPGAQSPMHRTHSLDYGVVLEGEIELILEDWDGPVRLMRRGDVSVQRGTMHAWRNPSASKWVRMLYVLVDAELPAFEGKNLDEDYGGIDLAA